MKFVLVLLVSEAAGWAAADSRAYCLGRLWRSLGRDEEADAEFAKVKELAQEEQPAPLIKTPGRQEK